MTKKTTPAQLSTSSSVPSANSRVQEPSVRRTVVVQRHELVRLQPSEAQQLPSSKPAAVSPSAPARSKQIARAVRPASALTHQPQPVGEALCLLCGSRPSSTTLRLGPISVRVCSTCGRRAVVGVDLLSALLR